MSSPAHLPRGSASDGLLLQIDVSNVLQVRDVLVAQLGSMQLALGRAERQLNLGPCGRDPVSLQAAASFRTKIEEIKAVHWAHVAELREATDRLAEAARHYGFTEEQLKGSFSSSPSSTRSEHASPDTPGAGGTP
ncbi:MULTISPECIES: PE domain-containing protein [Pseudonocardia]|uniref:PE domain-containing protein n=2 Tax=Pseudonocardia TaxID=1847 RepID=A0A1Y2MS00_PSEAH|nr:MULTISPECIES: PE domain-containing protein [Pseudonocardia]OSY37995.1 hypothetical protein BG845_04402 [Pseudonocardia autotrophica]TDN74656.1 PE family protein [Pseudonocardia autotrophica]BBG05428.1 hypothetical protein Pdca_66370 [Pseudonocardia autotrophica]GEC26401.1 hypothetical protein PSA01_34300 [Pseudonocardia saturnea]